MHENLKVHKESFMIRRIAIFIMVLMILIPICLTAQAPVARQADLRAGEPVSKQAVITQELRGGEVELQATGIYTSSEKSKSKAKKDIQKNGETNAIEDAKKAAIYHVLFLGNDPIIVKSEDRMRFTTRGDFVYETQNMNRYITYEASSINAKEVFDDGTTIKVSKILRVNKPQLIRELKNKGIIQDSSPFDEFE